MSEIPLGAPNRFMRGETVQWRVKSDYEPDDGWTLTVAFVQTADQRSVLGTDYGDGSFLVTIDQDAAALFQEGYYRYQESVSDGTATHLLGRGVIRVLPNFLDITSGYDGRSHAAKMWDDITALMEDKARADQSTMSQQDMSLTRYQWEDLLEQKGHYAHQMTDDERIARGYKPRRQKAARFIRI